MFTAIADDTAVQITSTDDPKIKRITQMASEVLQFACVITIRNLRQNKM